jgi:hypothetical protein
MYKEKTKTGARPAKWAPRLPTLPVIVSRKRHGKPVCWGGDVDCVNEAPVKAGNITQALGRASICCMCLFSSSLNLWYSVSCT